MDGVGAETFVVLAFQVLDDECGQVGDVGTYQATEEVLQPDVVQFVEVEKSESLILYALQVLVPGEGLLEIDYETDPLWIQLGRVVGLATLDDATVVEQQVELALDVGQGRLGVFPVAEHGRTIFDFLCLQGVPVPLDPDLHEALDFLVVSLAQGVQGGVIIVFLRAGDQFLEGFLAVFG